MKILSWIFNFSKKHHMDAVRYERHGKLSRILTILFTPLILAFGVGCIYFACTLDTNVILKFFAIIIAIIVSLACIEAVGVYSVCGFIFFAWGSLESFANRRQKRKQEKLAKKLSSQQPPQTSLASNQPSTSPLSSETTQNLTSQNTTSIGQQVETQQSSQEPEVATQQKKPVSKWLDLFVGIYCLALAVVGFFATLYVFSIGL